MTIAHNVNVCKLLAYSEHCFVTFLYPPARTCDIFVVSLPEPARPVGYGLTHASLVAPLYMSPCEAKLFVCLCIYMYVYI